SQLLESSRGVRRSQYTARCGKSDYGKDRRVFSHGHLEALGLKPTTLVPLDGALFGRKAGDRYEFLAIEATSMIGLGIAFMRRPHAATTFASNCALAQRSSSASASTAARAFLYVRS